MTIAYQIWKGKTHEELGLPPHNWAARKSILERFLESWSGTDESFNDDFIVWIKEHQHLPPEMFPGATMQGVQANLPKEQMPKGVKLVQNFGGAMVDFAKSGFKVCSDEEAERRFAICLTCEFLQNGERCLKCGCWMKYKSKLEAMTCKANKW